MKWQTDKISESALAFLLRLHLMSVLFILRFLYFEKIIKLVTDAIFGVNYKMIFSQITIVFVMSQLTNHFNLFSSKLIQEVVYSD